MWYVALAPAFLMASAVYFGSYSLFQGWLLLGILFILPVIGLFLLHFDGNILVPKKKFCQKCGKERKAKEILCEICLFKERINKEQKGKPFFAEAKESEERKKPILK